MKSKKSKIIAGIAGGVIVVATALFVTLYLIPYNEAKVEYNIAKEQYDAKVTELKQINLELNENADQLEETVGAPDIPIDQFLISSAQDMVKEARECSQKEIAQAPGAPFSIDKIKPVSAEVLEAKDVVSELVDSNGEVLTKIKEASEHYSSIITNFATASIDVEWFNVDQDLTVLRFVSKITKPNDAVLRDVEIEWTAYDAQGAVVGSYSGMQSDIPANGSIYYVGGAGGANLSATPASVEVKAISDGILTNRVNPNIEVSNIQIKNAFFGGSYDVSAECKTDTEISTSRLDGQFILKDENGTIIDAEFWSADNLPEMIKEEGKFVVSDYFLNVPAIPTTAEVYMYYVMND